MSETLPLSKDGFLDRKIWLWQPQKGYRIAIDPLFLAASLSLKPNEEVLDVGCGVGAISCFLLAREPTLQITGIEKNADILSLAQKNHMENGFAHAFKPVCSAIETLTLSQRFDHVVSNPPFYAHEAHTQAQAPLKTEAHHATLSLQSWLQLALQFLKPKGQFTVILPPPCLPAFMEAVGQSLGHLHLFPLWPRAHSPAHRLIIQGRKGSKAPLRLCVGLVLHEANGSYTPAAEDILRGGSLAWEAA